MNAEVYQREQMKLEAHQTIKALQLVEQGSGAMNKVVVESCQQLMADMQKELLSSMGAPPPTTYMASEGSISQMK